VPRREITDQQVEYPEKLFYLGQTVKCRVVSCSHGDGKLILSLRVGLFVIFDSTVFYLHMPIGKVHVDISVTVCVCVCTVTDFSGEGKASGIKFCTAVHLPFWETVLPQKPKIGRIGA